MPAAVVRTQPPIAVLLPVRNAAATLDATLRSLWRQTWTDFEVIAVDDGSTDATPAILRRHADREPRLRVESGPHRGLVNALERARGNATAAYLARLDADDLCHPHRFERQLCYLKEHPSVAAVGCKVRIFPRHRLGPGWRRYESWLNRLITAADHARDCFVESPLAHPSVLMRASAVEDVGGYRKCGWAEDYDLWLRLLGAGWDLAKVDATLLAWRHTETRLSRTHPDYHLRAFLRARAHYLSRHPAFHRRRTAIWGAGKTGRRLARFLAREGLRTVRFYDVDPKKIGERFEDAPVLSWRELSAPSDPLVVAVGSPGARGIIATEVRRRGYREGTDVFFTA